MPKRRYPAVAQTAIAMIAVIGLTPAIALSQQTVEIPADAVARIAAAKGGGEKEDKPEFPPFDDVSKDYEKVISTTDGKSLYTLWVRNKDAQVLAELPRGFDGQKFFIAYNIAGGNPFAGIQLNDMLVSWKRFDTKLALIAPNLGVRTTGDLESKKGYERVFTDRVVLSVPIVTMGPGGGPVIDLDALLVGQAPVFYGAAGRGLDASLMKVAKAKAFPENIELAFEVPGQGGQITTLAYSISELPKNTGYKSREADPRIGYFTTSYLDVAKPGEDDPFVRYVNRWNLEKADPKLKKSPPKAPIVFYMEHTIPVRYRRWVREGILEWNKAFEKVGIINAIEVYQQDARTLVHMDKDPEDVRYNFLLWTNAPIGFAIGPSRVDPQTGQILDADIVMSEGFIRSWTRQWREIVPQVAMEGFAPETLAWLHQRPNWDPRVLLAEPSQRPSVIERLAREGPAHPAFSANSTLLGDDEYDGLTARVSQVNGGCMYPQMLSIDLALVRLNPEFFGLVAGEEGDGGGKGGEGKGDSEGDVLDGVPDSFIGPMLKEVIMHEVGHTLGLRHNFKASTIYSIQEINTNEFKGQPQTGSVMDYNPININFDDGPVQGDWTMVTLGPYDVWAIEYGYTFDNELKKITARVAEDELPYATDEDTFGPDPTARRFDYGADPLDYAESQLRLIKHLRGEILERVVKDGQSWAKSRNAYELLLGKQIGAISISASWLGGAYVNRDRKGDPGARDPITVVPAEKQRRALKLVTDNAFTDAAFGLTPELLAKMTVDKWWDSGTASMESGWEIHDRIMGIQASALTMVLNPSTLRRVFDNEFRVAAGQDAFTLPEIINGVSDQVWAELDAEANGSTYTARQPMISSLRRNLQAQQLDRLTELALNPGRGAAAKPISDLSLFKLRELRDKINATLEQGGYRIDPYTQAHLAQARAVIDTALEAQYIRNLDDIRVNVTMPGFPFATDQKPQD